MKARIAPAVSLVILLAGLMSLATVRKKEDPILNTQTSPIAYQEKMEEIKDGEKGAPTPSFKLYPGEKFMTASPVEEKVSNGSASSLQGLPRPGDPIPEDLSDRQAGEDQKSEEDSEEWWQEEDSEPPAMQEDDAEENSFKDLSEMDETGRKTSKEEKVR